MRAKSIKISDPQSYFSKWHYRIEKHHYETLGVAMRDFVKEKTPFTCYALQAPPDFQFCQGYVFHEATQPGSYLQVAAELDPFTIEVHHGWQIQQPSRVAGYAVGTADFADWLRTGERPTLFTRLDVSSSKGGLMAWSLATPEY